VDARTARRSPDEGLEVWAATGRITVMSRDDRSVMDSPEALTAVGSELLHLDAEPKPRQLGLGRRMRSLMKRLREKGIRLRL
jgi:hypothetical protein